MGSHTVIDGNAFYEIDEDCMQKKQREQKQKEEKEAKEKASSPEKKMPYTELK